LTDHYQRQLSLCCKLALAIICFSIISRSEYKNWTFWLVEKLIIWRYIHPAGAWLLSSTPLPSRQVNMADSCWIKFSFIRKTSLQVQDIWKDGEFSKSLLSPFDWNSFQGLVFRAFRKRSGCVDRKQVRSIDRHLFFFKLKLLIFRGWWQLWMKSTTTNFSRCFARLFYGRTRQVNWLTSDAHVSLLSRTTK